MSLESIMSRIPNGSTKVLMPGHHESLSLVKDPLNYIEPEFKEIKNVADSRFIVFSAPGATGKTTLAKYISKCSGGIYWDLSKIFLGEGSFHGNIVKAIGCDNLTTFFTNLKSGKELLVIDAFDESETIAGRKPIEYFMSDLIDVTEGSTCPTVILLARTETALFLTELLSNSDVQYSHFEIEFISQTNAKQLMKSIIKSKHQDSSDTLISNYIEEQFNVIKRLLEDSNDIDSFLGYAPVLEVLSAAFDQDTNMIRYLNTLSTGATSAKIVAEIMDALFDREQNKVCNALQQKWAKKSSLNIEWSSVYTKDEQIAYLIEYLIFGSTEASFFQNKTVPVDLYEEYMNAIPAFLRQHPFILCTVEDNHESQTKFAGPAFRDYVLAFLLANPDEMFVELAETYFDESRKKGLYCTSQILYECYKELSNEITGSVMLSYLYDSFKSKENITDITHLKIYDGDVDDNNNCTTYAEFELERRNSELSNDLFTLTKNNKKLSFRQLVNVDIDADYKITVGGDAVNNVRISNSTVICRKLTWHTDSVSLENEDDSEILISAKEPFATANNKRPKFVTRNSKSKPNIRVDVPSMESYYGLLAYKCNIAEEDIHDFNSFACAVRRILGCLRSHSKDTPARKRDFIDNRIIGDNTSKKKALEFLMHKGILYTDHQDWLYKLNSDTLASFSVKWNDVSRGKLDSLKSLYKQFNEYE